MSALAHAYGPWTFRDCEGDCDLEGGKMVRREVPPDYSGAGYGNNPGIFDANGDRVVGCEEYNVFSRDDGRQAANVSLLLAAPDLLAALQTCIEFIQDAHILEAQWDWDPIGEAERAIAKAAPP